MPTKYTGWLALKWAGDRKGQIMRKIIETLFWIAMGLLALAMPTLVLFGGF